MDLKVIEKSVHGECTDFFVISSVSDLLVGKAKKKEGYYESKKIKNNILLF